MKIILWLGSATMGETILKGRSIRKFEDHCSRPISRLEAEQVPKGEVESVVHEEVCSTSKELNEFVN